MGTAGTPQPSPQSLSENGSQNQTREALLFAQQLADHEIESIERIHARTLRSFGYIGIVVVAVAGLFGYIGFANLRDAAISAAQSQMQKEIAGQVQAKLTEENIDRIVQKQIESFTSKTLTAEIHKVLTEPPVSLSIKEAADTETQQMIHRQFSPRRFTAEQSKLLIEQVNAMKELDAVPISVNSLIFSVEASNYAAKLKESLSRSKMKVVDFDGFPDAPQVEGVGIYYDAQHGDAKAHLLGEALSAAGLKFRFVPIPGLPATAPPSPLEIYIGAKPME